MKRGRYDDKRAYWNNLQFADACLNYLFTLLLSLSAKKKGKKNCLQLGFNPNEWEKSFNYTFHFLSFIEGTQKNCLQYCTLCRHFNIVRQGSSGKRLVHTFVSHRLTSGPLGNGTTNVEKMSSKENSFEEFSQIYFQNLILKNHIDIYL